MTIAYTTARPGDYILVGEDDELPPGYTLTPPPEAEEGCRVEWIDGAWAQVELPGEPEPAELAAVQAELVVQIDTEAEAARMRFITPGSGQALAYWQKSLEATACLNDPDPLPETYPLLAAEIGITAPTLAGVAAVVDGERAAWVPIGAAIETLRLYAKQAVRAAETIQAAQAAAVVEWPAPPEA